MSTDSIGDTWNDWHVLLVACQSEAVGRLVYTSTYNVVFGGQEIVNGDESLPYLPLDQVCSITVLLLLA